jgi:drug/metabolite transporter (DMT)-like permease
MFGYQAGERLSLYGWVGCLCILLGMIAGELRLSRFFKRDEATGRFRY